MVAQYRSRIYNDCEAVTSVVQAKEENWSYVAAKLDAVITTVAVGLDGTCMLLCEASWREAMVGTVTLYDAEGERQHTIYLVHFQQTCCAIGARGSVGENEQAWNSR
jgi:hypothetical protein